MAISLVQSKSGSSSSTLISVTLDDMPTVGNLLVAWVWHRTVGHTTDVDGFTAVAPYVADAEGEAGRMWYRVVQPGDSATIDGLGDDPGPTGMVVAEFSGVGALDTFDTYEDDITFFGGGTLTAGTVTPTAGAEVLLVAAGVAGSNPGDNAVTTPNGDAIEIFETSPGGGPESWMAYQVVAEASGSYTVDAAMTLNANGQGGTLAAFVAGDAAPTPPPGPPVVEISDSTDTLIATFSGDEIVDWKIRDELEGTGAGSFTIRRDHPDATETNLKTGNVVRVTIPRIDPDPIFAFIIGPKTAHVISKDEEGGETITVIGDGILSYLRREIIWHNSWELGFMTDPPAGGVIKTAATGMKPGQLLNRLVAEAQRAERPLGAIPLVTRDFDYDVDSDGNTWASATQTTELLGYVGDNLLDDLCGRLLGTGVITIRMGPDFDLHAYNTYGRDLTSLTFAADKVRFVRGVNIADALKRETEAEIPPNGALVVGEDDTYTVGEITTGYPDRTIFIKTQGTDTTALEANAEGELTRMLSRHESLPFKLAIGKPGTEDELTGKYLPGPPDSANGHFWVGDEVTIHTGTGNFDLNNHTAIVQAITLSGDKADNLEAIIEPGAVIKIGPRSSPRASGRGVQPAGGAGGSLPTGTPPPTGDAVLLSGHAADTSDAHDASAISVLDTAAHFAGTNVETVLDEIADSHDAHVADASDAHDASAISVADAGGNFTADNVEDVLAELADGGGDHALDDLTDVSVPTPNDNDVLTWDDYLQLWVAAAGSGGVTLSNDTPLVESGSGDEGTSGEASRSDHVHPADGGGGGGAAVLPLDVPPGSPHASDDEFDDSTGMSGSTNGLDAKWTNPITSTRATTVTFPGEYLMMEPTASGSASTGSRGPFGIRQPAPSGSFTIMAKIIYEHRANDCRAGIFAERLTATVKAHLLGIQDSAAKGADVVGITTPSHTADWSSFDGFVVNVNAAGDTFPMWHKMVWDSATSTFSFYYSVNGYFWTLLTTRASQQQPEYIGLAEYGNTAVILADQRVAFEWFRVTEP